jgi:hypothetical protein
MEYDLSLPCSGRMIDYWLGGTHNFEIDRRLADQLERPFPLMRVLPRDERDLTRRCLSSSIDRGREPYSIPPLARTA